MLIFLFLILGLSAPAISEAQVNCYSYNGGKTLSCDGPRGNSSTTEFSPGQGIITQHNRDGSSNLTPYTIIGQDNRRSSGIQPLRELDRLPSLETPNRFDREERDAFRPLLLLPE